MGRRGLWTGKRLRAISRELAQLGVRACPNTVRRLLEELGYALHANRKSLCSSSPHRNQQSGYLTNQRQQFSQRGYPIISVDSKKKELVGQFKQGEFTKLFGSLAGGRGGNGWHSDDVRRSWP